MKKGWDVNTFFRCILNGEMRSQSRSAPKKPNTVATLRRLPRRMLRKCDAFPRLAPDFPDLSLEEHPLRRGGLSLGRLVGESQLDAASKGAERQQLLL